MLTIPEIFGRVGEVFPPLVDSIIVEAVNTPYTFVSLPEFQALPPHRVAQVYWQEMLYRVHWATTSNLLRHQRWFESCRILSVEQPNFLGFCACLRGLAEGAADASHSLFLKPWPPIITAFALRSVGKPRLSWSPKRWKTCSFTFNMHAGLNKTNRHLRPTVQKPRHGTFLRSIVPQIR
jgi:hypothetical protein